MKFVKVAKCLLLTALITTFCSCGGKNNGSEIVDDLERDENGAFVVDYLDNVQLNVWTVVGDPDLTKFIKLVDQFNIEYAGMIEINLTSVGHNEYYSSLDTTYVNDYESFPDVCFMHNEKNIEYASKDYFRPVDDLIESVGIDFSFDNVYENIEKTTLKDNKHYGIPVDAHGYLTHFRQDIIKKNNLGFENNTRFIPTNYDEYQDLLEGLHELEESGELWVRNITTGENHAWYQLKNGNPNLNSAVTVTSESFYPTFIPGAEGEGDNLTALYVNGGSLLDSNGKVNFHNSEGFNDYVTDYVDRYNMGLIGDVGSKDSAFPKGELAMFLEGPWMYNKYALMWNNAQLKEAGKLGVTEEDATDPVYSKPYAVSRPTWLARENAPAELKDKWYGNGHVITLNKKITSMQKAAAALVFASWFTQEKTLTSWCEEGHIPAWKNVYDSQVYKTSQAKTPTLKAMGNPADIIALESTKYASVLISGVNTAVGSVKTVLINGETCTFDEAKLKVKTVAQSTQESIDFLGLTGGN